MLNCFKRTDFSPYWRQGDVIPTSPLTRTEHPKNRFEGEDAKLRNAIDRAAEEHQPTGFDIPVREPCGQNVTLAKDPYAKEHVKCILCPRRYAVDYIKPNFKNPKLLAQFVSPHTGLVYKKHITGLCQHMQEAVEREAKKAQASGFMSTKIKEIHYLKDPPLFDAARPTRPNPY